MKKLFYRPEGAVCADFIPFCEGGAFELFYLRDWRDEAAFGRGTPWYRISTDDFLHYREHGEALARGSEQEQDLFVFTGSVIAAQGRYHIFYTGHNPDFASQGKPAQAVMHAVSEDMDHWVKRPEDTFYADAARYDPDHFRDPFVFWDEEAGLYRMLLVARRREANYNAGFTAQYTSSDLVRWEEAEPFWAPNLYNTHECPDLFRMGRWWYLVFSEYSDTRRTRYVMADSLQGPWRMPADDCFDGKAYYAAKTAQRGGKRYLFGWIATRSGNSDDGAWEWGGSLAVHELVQREDGTLGCRMPEELEPAWSPAERLAEIALPGAGGKDERLLFTGCEGCWRVDMDLTFEPGAYSFGLALGQDFATRHGYKLEFLPGEGIMRFGAVTRALESADLYRRIPMAAGAPLHLTLIAEGEVLVLYAGDQALSIRLCQPRGGDLSLFCVGGGLKARDITRYLLSQE